tara:strand:- start:1964 stop:2140 length:177 start_codon:yes stop_codon:yes gene_type:complete
MLVYAVMCESWDGERDVTEVYELYAKEDVAVDFVTTAMSAKRSSYSPTYWVETMEVKG